MTFAEVNTMLAAINTAAGLNGYAYYQFPPNQAPDLPYAIFYYPTTDNVGADGIVWASVYALNIELYTANKDFETETLLESVLTEYGLFFNKTETYLNDENMYEVLYEMEVVING